MTDTVPTEPALERTRGFRWGQVPSVRSLGLAAEAAQPEPDLGAIASFTGTFKGTGFNTIFRPQDFAVTPTPLPNPTHGPDDNILKLNLTEETLSFSSALLRTVRADDPASGRSLIVAWSRATCSSTAFRTCRPSTTSAIPPNLSGSISSQVSG